MKFILVSMFLSVGLLNVNVASADIGDWEEVKTLCKKGAVNKQDRAHRPSVNCNYTEEGGTYTEEQVKDYYYKKNVVDPVFNNFVATFSTDKSKATRTFQKDSYKEGNDKETVRDEPAKITCLSTTYVESINFSYDRANTCQLMKDHPTPKTFCDHVYHEVLTSEERTRYTKRKANRTQTCRSDKGGRY